MNNKKLLNLIFSLLVLHNVQAWNGTYNLPPNEQIQKIIFKSDAVNKTDNNKALLYYKAAIPPNMPIPWILRKGHTGYLKVLIPPGVEELTISINAESLAASRAVMFRDYGEMNCDGKIPEDPTMEIDNSKKTETTDPDFLITKPSDNWLTLTGSSSVIHDRDQKFLNTSSCVFFGLVNINNNYGTGIELQDVLLIYTISDIPMFENWVNNDFQSTETPPENVILKIDPPSNGIVVNYNNENLNIYYHENKNILCSKDLFEDCSAEFPQNTQVILIAVPTSGFILESWGNNTTTKENFIIFDGKENQIYSPKFIQSK
jgi:hypothetical protein